MKKIEIFRGCMNDSTRIDGVDINDIEITELKKMIKLLIDDVNSNQELKEILDILVDNDENYILTDEYNSECDQCGDYIWDRTYERNN